MRRSSSFDITLFVAVILLIAVGWCFIYSASYPRAMLSPETNFNSFYFAFRQILFTVAGAIMMFFCWKTPLQWFRRWSVWIIGGTVLLLIAVLFFAKVTHGNRAYIDIGPIQFQPSEFTKIAIVLTLSAFLARRPWLVKSWKGLWAGPIYFIIVPMVLVLAEQDIGMTLAITLGTTVLLLISGMKFRFVGLPMLVFAALGVVIYGALAVASHGSVIELLKEKGGQRFERVLAWRDPWDESLAASYHPRNSIIAIGSGGPLGRGIPNSRQKWFYLPAPHNDYIASVIAEEIGFVGMLFVLGLYGLLVFRGFSVAHRAPDEYSAMVAAGCTVMLISSALVNMAVASNLLPSIGLNLPFISYGGSSLIASMMMAGLLLNISGMQPAREGRRHGEMAEAPV